MNVFMIGYLHSRLEPPETSHSNPHDLDPRPTHPKNDRPHHPEFTASPGLIKGRKIPDFNKAPLNNKNGKTDTFPSIQIWLLRQDTTT